MIIFDFITPDEIAELPDDDSRAAFAKFVQIALRRLGERTAQLDLNDSNDWDTQKEAQYGFINVVVAAAKKYDIQPLATLQVPRVNDFNDINYRQFRADLDHYLTQLVLDNSARSKKDSVPISDDLRRKLRAYVYHMRELIERATDIEESKRQNLLRRLSEFDGELDKKRLSLMTVAVLAITIIGAPGATSSSVDTLNKLMTNILHVVGVAKSSDDATRLAPSSEPPMALAGPRTNVSVGVKTSDVDIPF